MGNLAARRRGIIIAADADCLLAALAPLGICWSVFAALTFALGYVRHRQLLYPEFSEDHLRSVMTQEERLYLEGTLRHEPEKLPNRSRWQVRAERIWHPTGAEEITGDILLSVRAVRRDWHYGDRVRFWIRPVDPARQRQSRRLQLRDLSWRAAEIYATGFLDSDERS